MEVYIPMLMDLLCVNISASIAVAPGVTHPYIILRGLINPSTYYLQL